MICPSCNNGIVNPSINSKALRISYRGFEKEVATLDMDQCSNCLYESTGSHKGIDIDLERVVFQREVNIMLSRGEII